jgi:gluconolactonase
MASTAPSPKFFAVAAALVMAAAVAAACGHDEPGDIAYPHPLEGTSREASLVSGGHAFTEGPVWTGSRLFFTSIPANEIRELHDDGETSVHRSETGGGNGLAVDGQGRVYACEGTAGRVTRSGPQAAPPWEVVAAEHMGARFNQPNDIAVRKDGTAYFTDPNYTGDAGAQDQQAVYHVTPAGEVRRLGHVFHNPNGIALAPDERTLYVCEFYKGELLAAPVKEDGAVGTFTKIADAEKGDGMTVDAAGNLYVATPSGVQVFDASGGDLGTIAVPARPSNCVFGGPDRHTLYITANTTFGVHPESGVYAIRLNVPGAR